MFEQMKAFGAVAGLLKDKERMQAVAERLRAEAEAMRIEGTAGAGACRAIADGRLRILSVTLDPALAMGLGAGDDARAMGQALIADAVNDAITKAQLAMAQVLEREAQELGLPISGSHLRGLLT